MVNNLIAWSFAGVVVGWLAGRVMPPHEGQTPLNIILGIMGAVLAGWFLTPVFGISTLNEDYFSRPALLVSLLGGSLLLAVVALSRWRAWRTRKRLSSFSAEHPQNLGQ